jgi:hypothetical protein
MARDPTEIARGVRVSFVMMASPIENRPAPIRHK